MASVQAVQSFLAYWFQLGKPVVLQHRNMQTLPTPVFKGDQLSPAFQECWRQIMEHPESCFLKGTHESISQLLSASWDIERCARCIMPVPMPVRGINSATCPCADLPTWPNYEVPIPREAVCTHTHLGNLRQRLDDIAADDRDLLQATFAHSPNLPGTISAPASPKTKTRLEPSAGDD
ncbi:MAG: hypothetical protein AAF722_04045 [Cyanobacteria bacterium P01_C01_bin.70]